MLWKHLAAYALPVLKATIGQRVVFAEAATHGSTVVETEPESLAAREVLSLVQEIREECVVSERQGKKQMTIPKKPRADDWVAQGREKPVRTEQKMKRLTLDLPEGLHRAIKRRAVEEGRHDGGHAPDALGGAV